MKFFARLMGIVVENDCDFVLQHNDQGAEIALTVRPNDDKNASWDSWYVTDNLDEAAKEIIVKMIDDEWLGTYTFTVHERKELGLPFSLLDILEVATNQFGQEIENSMQLNANDPIIQGRPVKMVITPRDFMTIADAFDQEENVDAEAVHGADAIILDISWMVADRNFDFVEFEVNFDDWELYPPHD